MKSRDYLVFSSVGDHHNLKWLNNNDKRNFDLVCYYYGDQEISDIKADQVINRKGLKFENFVHFENTTNLKKYKAIWIVDDDMIMNVKSVNKMFRIFINRNLCLAQPSFIKGGKVPFRITLNQPGNTLRYTNFVENNCAIFSTSVLDLFMQSFKDAGTGFGVDFIWPMLLGFPRKKIAIIDGVSCYHPITEDSELDKIVPRKQHKIQGIKLLMKYNLLPPTTATVTEKDWKLPFRIEEYDSIKRTRFRFWLRK